MTWKPARGRRRDGRGVVGLLAELDLAERGRGPDRDEPLRQRVAEPGAAAFDTFERYDATTGKLVTPGRLSTPRTNASALRLSDASVLVVGGAKSTGGAPLRSMERLTDPEASARSSPDEALEDAWQ